MPVAETVLPAAYDGPVPEWPLPGRKVAGELALWGELWKIPQAAAWARMGPGVWRVVARYVVLSRTASLAAASEIRQIEDRLGLNPLAMRRLGWDVVRPEVGPAEVPVNPTDPDADVSTVADPYAGLHVVVNP
jgi:hypothetical protein